MIIGIDPGKNGGIAYIPQQGESDLKLSVITMPETETDITQALRPYGLPFIAYIEHVHSMPKQGVSSTFKFGMNYGILLGILAALNIKRVHVSPSKWQKALGCLSGGDKNVTKRRAQELFPGLKITHKTADALLIAEYGRRMETAIG